VNVGHAAGGDSGAELEKSKPTQYPCLQTAVHWYSRSLVLLPQVGAFLPLRLEVLGTGCALGGSVNARSCEGIRVRREMKLLRSPSSHTWFSVASLALLLLLLLTLAAFLAVAGCC